MSDITDDKSQGVSLLGLKVVNAVAFVVTLALNGISSVGLISPYGVGEISDKYPVKITPASTAFAIWGIIYSLQALFVIYQFFWPEQDEALLLQGVGYWFLSACMFNSLWIITFVQGTDFAVWVSTLLIIGLLFSICKIYVNTNCWRQARPGGVLQKIALDTHFSMYAGWVTVATLINCSIVVNFVLAAEPAMATAGAVAILVVALLLNTFIVVTRRDCVWGWVLAWASYWISVASEEGSDATLATIALVVSVLIGLVTAAVGAHTALASFRGTGVEQQKVELM